MTIPTYGAGHSWRRIARPVLLILNELLYLVIPLLVGVVIAVEVM